MQESCDSIRLVALARNNTGVSETHEKIHSSHRSNWTNLHLGKFVAIAFCMAGIGDAMARETPTIVTGKMTCQNSQFFVG